MGLLTVNTEYRNKLRVNLFRNSSNSAAYAESIPCFTTNSHKNTYASFNGSIVLDYSEYASSIIICTNGYYFGVDVNNLNSDITAALNNISYKIIDNKFNVVKRISSMPSYIANNRNACKSEKIQCQKGDLNYDGTIDSLDLLILSEYKMKIIEFSNLQLYLGDYDNNGTVELADYILLNKYVNSTATATELKVINSINQEMEEYMIENNYSTADILKVSKLSLID